MKNFKRFWILFVALLAVAIALLGTIGIASAHASTLASPKQTTQSCATLRADLVNALNADQAEDSILPDGVVTDATDLALANARAALIADGCSSGSGGFVPDYRFPGGYPYDFGVNTSSGDPTLCQNTLNAIARMDTKDQQQFATWGLTARYQTCAGTLPVTLPTTSPFNYSYGGVRCFGYYCY